MPKPPLRDKVMKKKVCSFCKGEEHADQLQGHDAAA